MRLLTWMAAVLGVEVIASEARPHSTISPHEANEIVGIVNNARSNVNVKAARMNAVSWDSSLQGALQAYADQMGSQWFFAKNQTLARFNGEALMHMAPFSEMFPAYDFLTHDGCQNDGNAVKRNFVFRVLNQAHCFDYNACSEAVEPRPGYINNYESCSAQPIPLMSHLSCSWFWQYYPPIVNDEMKTMACMMVNGPGPNAAGYRPNHFFCYYSPRKTQTSEIPYVAGESCSECDVDQTCQKRLCV